MRRFLNNRVSNYNNVGDKVDDFCEDCENRRLPFSRVWWDSTEKNIADIKRKDNGIFVIKKILSLINSISESIKDIYDRINVIELPILSEKLLELENDYLEVGVTADDKQEDLNIAIYENYINLKNTKVDKPLIESTSDSLKIVALDNQGESVFIKSNELGKVKSVNNKIGDVILKTSDLENDSDYTTNLKLNQERDERISGDNLKLDKPTTSGTTTTHPNIVGVDDLGNSAKLKATDFGKVKSVNGKEGDVILKTSDLENDSNFVTKPYVDTHIVNKTNPHNVTKSQIGLGNVDNTSDLNKPISTATQIELNKKINKPTTNNTPDYVLLADGSTAAKGDLGKNFANTDLVVTEPRKHTGNSIVEFGMPLVFSNPSQRFSGLQDKRVDATFNKIIGADATGNLGYIGGTAIVNKILELPNNSPEILSLFYKLNGNFTSADRISTLAIFPPVLEEGNGVIQMSLLGDGLIIPEDERITTVEAIHLETYNSYKIGFINYNDNTLKVLFDTSLYPVGTYKIRIVSGVQAHITNETFELKNKNSIQQIDVNTLTWNNFKNVGSTQPLNSIQQISPNSIKISREYGRDTPIGQVTTTKEIMLSDLVFTENENFSIEMEVIYKGQYYATGAEFDAKDFIGLILDSVIDSDNQLAIPINTITKGLSATNQFVKAISNYWWNANLYVRNMNTIVNNIIHNSQGENYTWKTHIVISRKNGVLYSTINGFNTIITTGNTEKFRLFFGVANSNGTQTYESVKITNIIKF